jgi:integrative and conjugative element protein (TIGR02256 family)
MRVWLDGRVKDVIEDEARRRRFLETGGPLFGYWAETGEEVVVGAAFGPGPKAKHRPRSLLPDPDSTEEAIRRVHSASNGRYIYLGSWHTHPGGQPRPSGVDTATARNIASQEDVELPRPLFLIQSTRPGHRVVRMGELIAHLWEAERSALEPVDRVELVKLDQLLIESSRRAYPDAAE